MTGEVEVGMWPAGALADGALLGYGRPEVVSEVRGTRAAQVQVLPDLEHGWAGLAEGAITGFELGDVVQARPHIWSPIDPIGMLHDRNDRGREVECQLELLDRTGWKPLIYPGFQRGASV